MRKILVLFIFLILTVKVFATDTFLKIDEEKVSECSWYDSFVGSCSETTVLFGKANISCANIYGSVSNLCNVNSSAYITNETEPMFNGNWSYLNSKPNNTFNSTYNALLTPSNSSNISNYCYNTFGITWNNLTTFNLNNAWTGSLGLGNISGGSVASNWNMSFYNQSFYLISNSVPNCFKFYNSSALLYCDCYNSTHKWLANSC